MAATARTATQLTHTTPVTLPASPGTAADTVNGDSFPNGGSSFLILNNTAGTSATASVAFVSTVDDQAVAPRVYTVPANTMQLVKLGPPSLYGSTVVVTGSATTLKIACYAF